MGGRKVFTLVLGPFDLGGLAYYIGHGDTSLISGLGKQRQAGLLSSRTISHTKPPTELG